MEKIRLTNQFDNIIHLVSDDFSIHSRISLWDLQNQQNRERTQEIGAWSED